MAEGIQWENIDYFNNKICCDLIEEKVQTLALYSTIYFGLNVYCCFLQRPPGVMMILDDVCNFPKGTDDKFREKVASAFQSHAHFGLTTNPDEFVIKHYAGDVCAFNSPDHEFSVNIN